MRQLISGQLRPPPVPKAKIAAQKRRRTVALPIPQERCRRSVGRPPAICPAGAAAYGFLKTRFLPHAVGQAMAGSPAEKEQFYLSFSLLCNHYGITPVDTRNFAYPYGREVALHEAGRLLREKLPQNVQIAFEQTDRNFLLTVTESYNTNQTLFFIPVLPLHQLLQEKKRRKPARLLLCIFAYLYRVAGVPFYREQDTYLYWNYEMLEQWVTDDPEEWGGDFYTFNSQINTAIHIGEVMLRRLYNKVHLERFAEWLKVFDPKDAFGRQCLFLAKRFFALWQDYPNANIYSHAFIDNPTDPDYYDDTDCITMEKYISFVATTDGWLYNQLEQYVNSDLGECSAMQEPVIRRRFDGQPQEADSLNYECLLFPLINELCYLLNNYEYDT